MTLKEMWDKVREIRGSRETKVEIALWIWGTGHGEEIKLKFWDGKCHHEAKSLEEIVRIAENTVNPPVSETELDSELPEIEDVDECRGCGGRINPDYGKCLRCE